MSRARIATIWLDGCSGCHMSFLDIDEALLDLAGRIELVYSPLVDAKELPEGIDVALVEGAVASHEDVERIRAVRARSRVLVALGDCAVTSNVPGMRNRFGERACLERAYLELADHAPGLPSEVVPRLLPRVCPVHEVVPVDVFVPGCPPPAAAILSVVSELLEGRVPDTVSGTRFGS